MTQMDSDRDLEKARLEVQITTLKGQLVIKILIKYIQT